MSDRIVNLCKQVVLPGDKIVAAVSGGADSMCLVHALNQACSLISAQLYVAHVNHQLRGEKAEEDARFVCCWAAENGLPRALVRVNVPHEGGESPQDGARTVRYQALAQVCRRFGANKLVTAHHADDQVETFLLNLLRGSGTRGLQGIPRQRSLNAQVQILRPLLEVTRREIEEYCKDNDLEWRTDSSNESLYYRRNRIRHHLLPILREYNPGIDEVLLKTVNNLCLDGEMLADLANQSLKATEVCSPLPFAPRALSLAGLNQLAPALKNRIVLELLPPDSQYRHVQAVLGLQGAATGTSIDLPGGYRAYRLHDSIALGSPPPEKVDPEITVPVPGQGCWGSYIVRTGLEDFSGSRCFWLPDCLESIIIGPRRPGDYFHPPGGGKKLKDYMIDKKIARWVRDTYPVLRVADEIFWVAGLVEDSRFARPGPGKSKVYIQLESTGG